MTTSISCEAQTIKKEWTNGQSESYRLCSVYNKEKMICKIQRNSQKKVYTFDAFDRQPNGQTNV